MRKAWQRTASRMSSWDASSVRARTIDRAMRTDVCNTPVWPARTHSTAGWSASSVANDYRLALMCAEKEPLECHRTLLVARALAEIGIVVQHILADGRLESHEAAMERLLDVVGLPHQDLFRSIDELIAEALVRQEQRVAYVDEKLAADAVRETP